jgi:hypothetical protein
MKPTLKLDLSGPDGNVFIVIGYARERLTGLMLEHYNEEIRAAIAPGAGKTYTDVLAIIDKYVSLEDTSGTHPDYSVCPEEE